MRSPTRRTGACGRIASCVALAAGMTTLPVTLPSSRASDTRTDGNPAAVMLTGLTTGVKAAEEDLERFWKPYLPSSGNSRAWLDGQYATMNWGGLRDRLGTNGVDLSLTYLNNIAGNPVGGKNAGFTYCDNFTLGLKLQTEPLFGWRGGTFNINALDRNGNNLTAQSVGNQFTVQQVYGGTGVIFYDLTYEQRFFRDLCSLKFGRMGAEDDFATSPIYWLYMNNGIDGTPQALPVNGLVSPYPWATWGARLKVRTGTETKALLGVYQVTADWFSYLHGLDWSINRGNGVMMIGQYCWSPEFFKPAGAAPESSSRDGDDKEPLPAAGKGIPAPEGGTSDIPRGLPGHYWMGGYYSTYSYPQFGSTNGVTGAYGLYWHFDQMVYRRSPHSTTGLTLWSAAVVCPQQNTAKMPFQYNGGLVYTGLLPCRPQDATVFGVAYGNFSDNYAQANRSTLGGYATYELLYEAGYKINLTKFAFIEPDLQWIINPGGTGTIPNALVLGAQIGVTF